MQRADFHCDDAWNNAARSSVVVIDQQDLFFPSTNKRHAYYMKAVKEAEAAYDIVSAEEPIFVRWVSDPQSFQDNFWRSGVGFLIASCCVHRYYHCGEKFDLEGAKVARERGLLR